MEREFYTESNRKICYYESNDLITRENCNKSQDTLNRLGVKNFSGYLIVD